MHISRFFFAVLVGLALSFATAPTEAFAANPKPPKAPKGNAAVSKKQAECYDRCNAPAMKCIKSCGSNGECMGKCQDKVRDCSEECGELPELPDLEEGEDE